MSKSKLDADDLVSALEFFEELEDPRSHVNRLHGLGDILVICVCAVVCGADGPKAIGIWAQAQEAWLRKYLLLPNEFPRTTRSRACWRRWMRRPFKVVSVVGLNRCKHRKMKREMTQQSRSHLSKPLPSMGRPCVARTIDDED